ncbi:MAG: formylglycine-generating enzyme family protein [Polyangiaceae bacterium]|nr:formylglycine-generating enzyme family protein [Polyangiaceae bacterium]
MKKAPSRQQVFALVISSCCLLLGAASIIWMARPSFGVKTRCPAPLIALGPRCCAPTQRVERSHCVGPAQRCPENFQASLGEKDEPICLPNSQTIPLKAGKVTLGPIDWDSADRIEKHELQVSAFRLDSHEVSAHLYRKCVRTKKCPRLPIDQLEPAQPVHPISLDAALDYCAFAGGRLPTPEEWTFAALGKEARRFPWGPHGLVCRRAVYGLKKGPCANHATQPEWTGSRPAGKSPDGFYDLAGNVAELTISSEGTLASHGGSFLSQRAAQLKSWSQLPIERPQRIDALLPDDVGFRCAYDSKEAPQTETKRPTPTLPQLGLSR